MMKKIAWLLVAVLLVATAVAQETTAGIQGTVKDPTGAVVSKAVVEVTGPALIGMKKVETDASGYFRFANLPPGEYILSASAQGFKTVKRQGIKLEVGKLPTIDLALEVGGSEQVVEVSSAAPIVDVTQSKVQTNLAAEVIDGIPKGRSFQSLIQLAPGARQEPLQGNGYQIDGASNAENSYLVEGQDTGNVQDGTSAANVPFEFVQEVQIKSGGFEAEYGGALGGVVNVIQKRGGNAWHGSVFTYYRGDMFDSVGSSTSPGGQQKYIRLVPNTTVNYCMTDSTSAACRAGTTYRLDRPVESIQPKKDSYRIVDPGFEAGGYLKKDRLWLFTSFVPRIDHTTRTVRWNGSQQGNIAAVQQNRTFNQDYNTYYTLARADYLVTSKIRVYGAWQDNYQTAAGNTFPSADNAYGAKLIGQGTCYDAVAQKALPCPTANTTATANPDNYNHALGYKAPNVIYNTGGDVTITPSLISTTRYGYFYTDNQARGNTQGVRYRWYDPTYPYNSYSASGAYALPAGSSAYNYNDTTSTPIAAAYAQAPGFSTIGPNTAQKFNKYWRKSFNQDLAYFKKGFLGTHNFKGGYANNRLKNDVDISYDSAWVFLGYGRSYSVGQSPLNQANCAKVNAYNNANFGTALTDNAVCGGLWGTYNLRDLRTNGQVASNNHSLYLQDAWTPGYGVTLNLGIRFDKEALPNYANALPGFKGIEFGFGQKMAPRLGASWDVFRNGKLKAYGSFGYFFDIMKYELPRGSFGGDYWHDCIYALDNPDYTLIVPHTQPSVGKNVYCPATGSAAAGFTVPAPGKPARDGNGFIANLDFRTPSNDPNNYAIDPNLKPMKQHEMTLGADWAINTQLGLETRYTRKRLDRTIEDAGYLNDAGGENFYIVNPGEGIHAAQGLVPATDCAGECGPQPKAVRNYDALEVRLTKKASAKWMGVLSYTYSRLWGNYAGLTNSDTWDGGSAVAGGGGRLSPNVGRAFDEPFMQYDSHGHQTFGLLGTDRPHTIKAYGFYRLKWLGMETLLGGTQFIFSGTPLSSYANVSQGPAPMFLEGRGNFISMHRDPVNGNIVVDSVGLKRTPNYSQTDLNLSHELKVSKTNEAMRVGFEANITNLFNQHAAVNYATQMWVDNDVLDAADHTPATSVSGADYPSWTKFGFNWLAQANSGRCNTSTTYGPPTNCTNPGNGGGVVFNNAYGMADSWQYSRSMRFKVKFTW